MFWKAKFSQAIICSKKRSIFLFLTAFLSLWCPILATSSTSDSYQILGVTTQSSQEDIRKKYRRMCLELHPDKNISKSNTERKICEDKFKQVQKAFSDIGDVTSRRNYDDSLRTPVFESRVPNPNFYSSSPFHGSNRNTFERRRAPFYVNGVDISALFSSSGFRSFGQPSAKVIFLQDVKIPLQELYTGSSSVRRKFKLKDNIIQRYRAAFRGGIGTQIVIQGFLSSLMVSVRSNFPTAILFFLGYCHFSMPRPRKFVYETAVKRGWKEGTRLKFNEVDPGFIIILTVREGRHDRFVRVGNNLHTTVKISSQKAQYGCRLLIKPLDDVAELPIEVILKRGEINGNKHNITVKGRGWPISTGARGDLVVKIQVLSNVMKWYEKGKILNRTKIRKTR